MKNRTGQWLIVVAILHLLISFISLWEPVRHAIDSTILAWYFSFGVMMLAGGIVVHKAQKSNRSSILETASVILLVLVIIWIIFIPLSSFWLALPAVMSPFFTVPSAAE